MYDTILSPKTQDGMPCLRKTRNSPKTPGFPGVQGAGMHKNGAHCAGLRPVL